MSVNCQNMLSRRKSRFFTMKGGAIGFAPLGDLEGFGSSLVDPLLPCPPRFLFFWLVVENRRNH